MSNNLNDKVYTPQHIVNDVMLNFSHLISRSDILMEPFKGEGVFYNEFKKYTDKHPIWCEIDLGVDFFNYEGSVDWIITNPPYSIFKEVLTKCLSVADNIVFVIPIGKLLTSMPRLTEIVRCGYGIREVFYLGSGRKLGFPFGFPVAAVHIKKGWCEGWYSEKYHPRCINNER
ncbi:hypothetical protein SIPHO054v2_p0019 [Vibrio phage 103E44.1]|nr:hypothetical protein SIPHO054v2_p0019 [Vibrio phage 103E44.1]QZI87875.1 hypothetical protein SIPHO055v2_p0019 [Vibrio phage 104E43.1]